MLLFCISDIFCHACLLAQAHRAPTVAFSVSISCNLGMCAWENTQPSPFWSRLSDISPHSATAASRRLCPIFVLPCVVLCISIWLLGPGQTLIDTVFFGLHKPDGSLGIGTEGEELEVFRTELGKKARGLMLDYWIIIHEVTIDNACYTDDQGGIICACQQG